MKKISLVFVLVVSTCFFLQAQDKFYTKTGRVFFKSTKTPLEKIEATNKSSTCVLDTKTGNLQFSVLMKGFEFEKALMQEHFNENYVESSKYPKSGFKGQVTNNNEVNYTKDGEYVAKVKGSLQLHGETKDVEATGKITVRNGKILASSSFEILLSDYKIRIPSLVSDKVANKVNVVIDCSLEPFKE